MNHERRAALDSPLKQVEIRSRGIVWMGQVERMVLSRELEEKTPRRTKKQMDEQRTN